MSRERLLALEVVRTYQRYAMINVIIYCRSVIPKYFEIEEESFAAQLSFLGIGSPPFFSSGA